MLALFVLVPLIAAMLLMAVLKEHGHKKSKYIAAAGSLAAFAIALLASYGSYTYHWFSIASYTFNISILVAPLNFMLLLLVLLIGTVVIIYSWGYMKLPSEQRRFYFQIIAFEISMATFAISGNFITLFIAWEFLSLTSYLLIGFWYQKDSANRAARKALTMIFIGDLALLGSIVLFYNALGTLEFTQIISSVGSGASAGVDAATMLLLVAIFTKSAQVPFHEWLIDAMEGPTPVSAYLHSSTMVKAGVFAAILLFPIFQATNTLGIILLFGLVTALIATLCALKELHIKKVIAYSTIQELSIMFVAIGIGAPLAAIYFFFAQTFYKALLFFSAGNIMEATERDYLNDASGLTSNPLIYYTTLAGVLSLAGFIPFAGFFANEGISNAVSSNMNVYLIMSLISVLTSFYIFRWMFYPSRKPKADIADRYSTQPATMVLPMALLAALALLASAFFFMISDFISYGNYLPFLSGLSLQINIMDSAIFLVLITIGAGLSYMAYVAENIAGGPLLIRIRDMLYTNPLVNLFYRAVYGFTYEVAEAASILDTGISDVFDDVGLLTVYSGNAIKRLSVGSINLYALMVIVGILAMFAAFYLTVIV